MKKWLSAVPLSLMVGVSVQAAGENCDDFVAAGMTCFENGTAAKADEVNANFKALLGEIEALKAIVASGQAAPDYDSGWFSVLTPASHQVITKKHNLNAFPTQYWIWFSPDDPPSDKIYPHGRGQSPNYNSTAGMNWEQPHGIAFSETEITLALVKGQAIGRFWNGKTWKTWQSGYWRILVWK